MTTTMTTAPTLESLFRSGQEGISSSIINYLDNDDKVQFACTCTGMREEVLHGKGVDIPIDPIIVVTRAENWPAIHPIYRGDRFLRTLDTHLRDDRTKNILLHHHYRIKIGQVDQFDSMNPVNADTVVNANTVKMNNITELDISVPAPTYLTGPTFAFVIRLTMMFQNLRKINLTNTSFLHSRLRLLAQYCPRLETIIWNHTTPSSGDVDATRGNHIPADGECFAAFRNLQEITLDHQCLYFSSQYVERRHVNLFRYHTVNRFLLQKLIRNNPLLTRISIENVTDNFRNFFDQHWLTEIVRNVPSLTYFRSDLILPNVTTLQSERPEIVFEPDPPPPQRRPRWLIELEAHLNEPPRPRVRTRRRNRNDHSNVVHAG